MYFYYLFWCLFYLCMLLWIMSMCTCIFMFIWFSLQCFLTIFSSNMIFVHFHLVLLISTVQRMCACDAWNVWLGFVDLSCVMWQTVIDFHSLCVVIWDHFLCECVWKILNFGLMVLEFCALNNVTRSVYESKGMKNDQSLNSRHWIVLTCLLLCIWDIMINCVRLTLEYSILVSSHELVREGVCICVLHIVSDVFECHFDVWVIIKCCVRLNTKEFEVNHFYDHNIIWIV